MTLVVIVMGVGFASVASDQLAQIRTLQAAAGGSQGAQQQSSSATTSSPVSPVVRHITLVAEDAKTQIANNVSYTGWTFNGTVPGPTITVNQGDTIFAKFINNVSTMAHSIDFHAAEIDWSTAYASVAPGQSKTFNSTVNYPGVFMYHCVTPTRPHDRPASEIPT